MCKTKGIEFHLVPQVHTWKDGNCNWQSHREPMNSELSALFTIGICHGVKGILPFAYEAWYFYNTPAPRGGNGVIELYTEPNNGDGYWYSFGITDFDDTSPFWGKYKRERNFYGEYKWDFIKSFYAKVKNSWSNIAANSPNTEGYSVNPNEGAFNRYYIYDIKSIDPLQTGQNPCVHDGIWEDCPGERYWEIGFFTLPPGSKDKSKYFMMVNKRCIPAGGGYDGDIRQLKVKFNGSQLNVAVNWKLYDAANPDIEPVTFSRNYNGYLNLGSTAGTLGYFNPGEGKLFKLTPVIQSGGIIVENEDIPGTEEFTCEDTVFNNGYNITIEDGAKIHFTDTSTIVMSDSGTFIMGDDSHQGPLTTQADAAPGNHWYGFNFSNCEVKIYSTTFAGLVNDSTYAVNIIDCPLVDIRGNVFNTESDNLKGGVSITYINSDNSPNIYLGYNTFNSNNSTLPALCLMSYAGVTTPAIIEGNTFNSSTSNSTAITLSGIIGGAVKSNQFTSYGKSLNGLSSSIDVSGNIITSSVASGFGIEALSGSEIKMNNAGELILGGRNNISNTGNNSNNIYVDNSYFLLDNGENIFNIAGNVQNYHLYGFFPDTYSQGYEATKNCFKVDNSPVQPPINYVTLGYQGNQIDFIFEPYLTGCTMGGEGEGLVINLGDGLYDTIGTRAGGGGMSMVLTPKTLYDSICIQMRFRNYNYVKEKCTELINTYPDSIYSLNAIPKLYLASSMTDTSTSGLTALKTFYENLILNHPNNTALVKRCNYFVQKCKVLLHQYNSALAGFEQIMLQNPYSYEGLVAKWDHMATQLLIQGQGGGEYELIPLLGGVDDDLSSDGVGYGDDDPAKSKQDKSPFTREQKIFISKTVNDALDVSRTADERRMDELTKRSDNGDVNATKELDVMKSLKEVVKPASPKNVFEHVKIVRDDMQRIFSSPGSKETNKINPIPAEFALSQNYPNPFNPITKINYDLPKDVKVSIVVYDILGREVRKLVNNEFKKAGRYTVEFNGINLASGVYFYRIEARQVGTLTGDFVLSKKMVLIK